MSQADGRSPELPKPLEVILGDSPGVALHGFECLFPDANSDGIDLVLPRWCKEHNRSLYWCTNADEIWCDGGPPEWEYHVVSEFPF